MGPFWVHFGASAPGIWLNQAVPGVPPQRVHHVIRGHGPPYHPIPGRINKGRNPLGRNGLWPFLLTNPPQAVSGRIRGFGSKLGPRRPAGG